MKFNPDSGLSPSRFVFVRILAPLCLLAASGTLADATRPVLAQDPKAATPAPAPTPTPAPVADGPVTAIVGGDIHTVSHEVIRKGTILFQNGKIIKLGQNLTVPPGAKVIDAKGKTVTPGFVAASLAGVGFGGGGGGRFGGGRSVTGRSGSLADSLDPYDKNLKFCLGVGVTSAAVQPSGGGGFRFGRSYMGEALNTRPIPNAFAHENATDPASEQAETAQAEHDPRWDAGKAEQLASLNILGISLNDGDAHGHGGAEDSACMICALRVIPNGLSPMGSPPPMEPPMPGGDTGPITGRRSVLMKMSYGKLDGMLIKEEPFYETTISTLTGALNRMQWRDNLKKAREYVKAQDAYDQAVKLGQKPTAPRKTISDTYIRIIKKELPVRVAASTVGQIREMLALAREFDYKLVLDDAHEAWLMADEIAAAKVPLVIVPRSLLSFRPGKENTSGSSIETARFCEKAGIPFAVATLINSYSPMGISGRDITSITNEAAFAVRGGASEKTALESLTTVPAQILGLGDRIGTLDVGKDADILILDGNPLDYRTYVVKAFVNGEEVYDRFADHVFATFERK